MDAMELWVWLYGDSGINEEDPDSDPYEMDD